MASILRAILSPDSSSGRVPSFNDFSLHVGSDGGRQIADSLLALVVEKDLEQPTAGSLASKAGAASHAPEPQNSHKTRRDCWQSTFSPQMNSNMKALPSDFYDNPNKSKPTTVWQQIIRSDRVKHAQFAAFDSNGDGMIDASDLKKALGPDADVGALIKQADRHGDGKIDHAEFCELLKSM